MQLSFIILSYFIFILLFVVILISDQQPAGFISQEGLIQDLIRMLILIVFSIIRLFLRLMLRNLFIKFLGLLIGFIRLCVFLSFTRILGGIRKFLNLH